MHPEPLPIGEISATPWSLNPAWFIALAVLLPALVWLACAWKRAFARDPNGIRRSGIKELRRVLRMVRRSQSDLRPWHLHAWLLATAKTWGVRFSAPTSGQLSQAMRALAADASLVAKWRELWCTAERGLYAANAAPPQDWLERASSAAAGIEMPPRERRFPNRVGDWLPSMTAGVVVATACIVPGAVHANQDEQAPPAQTLQKLKDAQEPARQALQVHWSDWAAHHNVAAFLMQKGDWNTAVAHATTAFLLRPASGMTRDNLRFALEQAGNADPHIRRMLSGMWYQRVPALLSPAAWQRLVLGAALLLAAGLTASVLALYLPKRRVIMTARCVIALGTALLITGLAGWNAYGLLNQPAAAILTRAVNLSPAPTDLVPEAETSPVAAGTVVLLRRSFLGWQQIAINDNVSGWVRRQAVMPFYVTDSSHSRRDRTS